MSEQPNILLILNDDMGYSDIGCYGGEIQTPTLNRLAENGIRFTSFYNTARCCPSRASLLTGLYPHQADVGHMVGNDHLDGYLGDLSRNAVTIAEVLKAAGYRTAISGKWHVTGDYEDGHNWPAQRGFDEVFTMLSGAGSYWDPCMLRRGNEPVRLEPGQYFTDAISDEAVAQLEKHHAAHPEQPLFQYVAYTAPHWPLHALPEDIAKYEGRFAEGWDVLRNQRLDRMRRMGLMDAGWDLSERSEGAEPWESRPDKDWEQKRMEVYAAQIDRMDQGIGRLMQALERTGRLENTLVVFLADNGGCNEDIVPAMADGIRSGRPSGRIRTRDESKEVRYGNHPSIIPGPEDTYSSYGSGWANLSNTPFRKYKKWTHEGGIATPLIVHWPKGVDARNRIRTQPAQLPDIMATFVEAAGADYPEAYHGHRIKPCEGCSLLPVLRENAAHGRDELYWEHEGNAACRIGPWKIVRDHPDGWELYHIEKDRPENHNLAADMPEKVRELEAKYTAWAERVGVRDWEWLCNVWRKREQ